MKVIALRSAPASISSWAISRWLRSAAPYNVGRGAAGQQILEVVLASVTGRIDQWMAFDVFKGRLTPELCLHSRLVWLRPIEFTHGLRHR